MNLWPSGLILVRGVHTLIYLIMSVSTLVLLYVGATGRLMEALWIVAPLLAVEVVVFTVGGLRCPLTAMVDRRAGPSHHVSDTFLPERLTRHTLSIFGPLLALGVMFVAVRSVEIIGGRS